MKRFSKGGSNLYVGHSEIIDTPFPNINERFIHQIEMQLF